MSKMRLCFVTVFFKATWQVRLEMEGKIKHETFEIKLSSKETNL